MFFGKINSYVKPNNGKPTVQNRSRRPLPRTKKGIDHGEMQRISVIGGVLRTDEVLVLGVDSGIRRLGGDLTRDSGKVHGRTQGLRNSVDYVAVDWELR
jgi:hypothetical protein